MAAKNDKKLFFNPEYNFDWFEHEYYTIDNDEQAGKVTFKCFCELDMIFNRNNLVCPKKACNFTIDYSSINQYISNDVLKATTIKLPICKKCSGSHLECYRNEEWSTYLYPIFRCSCKTNNQIFVTFSQFPDVMNHNFNLPTKETKEERKSVAILPKKKLNNEELVEDMEPAVESKGDKKQPIKRISTGKSLPKKAIKITAPIENEAE